MKNIFKRFKKITTKWVVSYTDTVVGYGEKIKMIEKVALETDNCLHKYILKAVTEGLSYTYLKTRLGIPCGKDMYYDRYRRFFWLLSKSRG